MEEVTVLEVVMAQFLAVAVAPWKEVALLPDRITAGVHQVFELGVSEQF
jgi:hypothetical protein